MGLTPEDREIKNRLDAAIERAGMSPDRERIAKYAAQLMIAEVKKIIAERLKEQKDLA